MVQISYLVKISYDIFISFCSHCLTVIVQTPGSVSCHGFFEGSAPLKRLRATEFTRSTLEFCTEFQVDVRTKHFYFLKPSLIERLLELCNSHRPI